MTTSFLSITPAKTGEQIVRRPMRTDAIGHALRGAFDDRSGLPEDMVRILGRLDVLPRTNG